MAEQPQTASMKCGQCGKTIRYPVSKAGKTGKCPGCGELIRLPSDVTGRVITTARARSPVPPAASLANVSHAPVSVRPVALAPILNTPAPDPSPSPLAAQANMGTTTNVTVNVIGAIEPRRMMTARDQSTPSRTTAAVLALLFFGPLGSHKFYIGQSQSGVIMAVTGILGVAGSCLIFPLALLLITSMIALIEGVIYLMKSDDQFHEDYVVNKKQWF